jgi:23S rRNA (guanosine2251-2'-O)-methyltransferase
MAERPVGMTRTPRSQEWIFGINPVFETLHGRRSLYRLLVRPDRINDQNVAPVLEAARTRGVVIENADRHQLDKLTNGGNHQGIALATGPFQYTRLDEMLDSARGRPILILDRLQDPQNLATLIRTCAAIAAAGVVIQTDRSASVTPAVVRSSAGTVERLAIARENNTRRAIDAVRDGGYWATALEQTESSVNIFTADIPEPVALVVGSEERGVSPTVVKDCDLVVHLPMPGGVESLNAAVAGSIALYETVRRTLARDD